MRPPDTQIVGERLPLILAVVLTCAGSVCAYAATARYLGIEDSRVSAKPIASTGQATDAEIALSTPVQTAGPTPRPPSAAPYTHVSAPATGGVLVRSAPSASASPATGGVTSRAPRPASARSVGSITPTPKSQAPGQAASITAASIAPPKPDAPCRLAIVQFKRGLKAPAVNARTPLPVALAWLQADPERRILLRGHADARGADYFNMRLSAQRARWIRRWLIREGIDPGRVTAQAFGEFLPVVDVLPVDARQRRVEIFGFGGPCPQKR